MSWLGSLFNAAKVGVGLLNGIMNPASGSNVDYETALLKGNPGHLIRVSLPGKDKERVYRILAVHVVVSNDKEKVGKTFNLYAGGNVDDGDVVFAVAEAPGGGNILTAVNNSPDRDYYINFGQTNAKALLSTQNMVIGRKGGKYPNLVDCTNAFNHYSLGNLVVTPVQVQADSDAFLSAMAPSVGIPFSPTLSPAPLTRSPFSFSRKKKSPEISQPACDSKDVGIPFSTILGNIGFASVIADTLFFIYNSAVGNIQIKWNTDGSGITSYIVMNRTSYKITVSVNVNWSNPAIGATVNVTVPPKGDAEGKLPDNDSPISSASVCAFTESSNYSAVVKAGFQQMESDNVKMYVAKFAKRSKPTPCDDGADSGLSTKDLQLLKAIKALGNEDAILKLGNGNGKKKATNEWDD